MVNFCEVQLSHTPLDSSRRRLTGISANHYELGCRTWRISFHIFPELHRIQLDSIRSNYRDDELLPSSHDKYGDKDLHRQFRLAFAWENNVGDVGEGKNFFSLEKKFFPSHTPPSFFKKSGVWLLPLVASAGTNFIGWIILLSDKSLKNRLFWYFLLEKFLLWCYFITNV